MPVHVLRFKYNQLKLFDTRTCVSALHQAEVSFVHVRCAVNATSARPAINARGIRNRGTSNVSGCSDNALMLSLRCCAASGYHAHEAFSQQPELGPGI
jgi:hypothetical protein